MVTTTKSARLTEEEIIFLNNLLPHFPEYRSESHFLHGATMLGLWMLAASARRPGLVQHGGYDAGDLAALLQPRILAALNFLAEQDRLPALVRGYQADTGVAGGEAAAMPQEPVHTAFDPEVAGDMADLGTEFME